VPRMSIVKRILAVVAGVFAGAGVIYAIESVSHRLYPPPPGTNLNDPAAIKAWIATLPGSAFFLVLLAYALGSLVGGTVATLLSGRTRLVPALIVGTLLLTLGLVNLATIPQPLWFSVASTALYIPCAWLGGVLVRRPESAPV
jgi:hypothetical protein